MQNPEVSEVENGFTIIDLIGLTDEAINELTDPSWNGNWAVGDLGLLGDKYQDYLASTKKGGRLSFRKFPPLLRFMHRLAMLIPVPYPSLTPVQLPPIRTMVRQLSAQCMDAITVQGIKLQRPMLILDQQTEADKLRRSGPPAKASSPSTTNPPQGIVTTISETLLNSNVQIRGYIWGQNTQIKFQDLAGIQVRIKNVGIGSYNFALFDPVQELDNRSSTRASRAQAISGEIFIDYSKELERALRGDREGFQESSPVYIELKTAVYKHVQKMYQRIDALAPSRQKGAAKKTPPIKPDNDSDTSSSKLNQDEPGPGAASVSVTAADSASQLPVTGYASDTKPEGQRNFSVPMPKEGEQEVGEPATTGQTDVAAAEPTFSGLSKPRSRLYKIPRNIHPTSALDLNQLTDTQVSGDEITVKVNSEMLPADLPKDKVDQVCVVAAALALAKVAQENHAALTEIGAALVLQLVEEDTFDVR